MPASNSSSNSSFNSNLNSNSNSNFSSNSNSSFGTSNSSSGADFNSYLIATRGSALALWQAKHVQSLLSKEGVTSELLPVTTTGDKMQKLALNEIHVDVQQRHLATGKGLFIKEIQESIFAGNAHIAVHSTKDLPVEQTSGLILAAMLPRASSADVLILSPKVLKETGLENLPWEIRKNFPFAQLKNKLLASPTFNQELIGTTSLRRQLLLKMHISPQLNLVILRGNVDTRLRRVRNDEFSAIMLAQAGLERLELLDTTDGIFPLSQDVFIPSPGQGVIAVEIVEGNPELLKTVLKFTCKETCIQAGIERLLLRLIGGDCHTAVGVHMDSKDRISIISQIGSEPIKQLCVSLDKSEKDMLYSIYDKSQGIYSLFFAELCSSAIANEWNKKLGLS